VARPTALQTATKALARRDRSAAGLIAYLEQRGAAPDEAAAAVGRLCEAGYVNDAHFAVVRAESLAARGYGDAAIRFELERDGVAAEEVDAALAALPPERERALTALRGGRQSPTVVRRLAAKGFSAEAIEGALAETGMDPSLD